MLFARETIRERIYRFESAFYQYRYTWLHFTSCHDFM